MHMNGNPWISYSKWGRSDFLQLARTCKLCGLLGKQLCGMKCPLRHDSQASHVLDLNVQREREREALAEKELDVHVLACMQLLMSYSP